MWTSNVIEENVFNVCKNILTPENFHIALQEKNANIENRRLFLTVLPIISMLTCFMNGLAAILVLIAMKKRQLPRRKYTAVITRLIADAATSLVTGIVALFANLESDFTAASLLALFVATFGIVQCSFCHILVCIIRQLSHERVVVYNELLKPTRVFSCSVLIWVISLLYATTFSPLFVAFVNPLNSKNVCAFSSCQSPLYLISIIFSAFLLCCITFFYCTILRRLFCSIGDERSRNELPVSKYRFRKFASYGAHVALYLLVVSLIIAGLVYLYPVAKDMTTLLDPIDQCHIFEYYEAQNTFQTICGCIILLWHVRMFFDPLMLLIFEYRRLALWTTESVNLHHLEEVHSTFSSSQPCESLKWKRHCPITEMERTITAWDIKTKH